MPLIYACYRRSDNPHVVGRVVGDLRACFGNERIFYDISSIQFGSSWPTKLEEELAACQILLVFIGKDWHSSWDEEVGPRLWHPDDWVRNEICRGLDSSEKIVIPILIDDTIMPKATALPSNCSLYKITKQQAARIRHSDYDTDIGKLIERIGEIINLQNGEIINSQNKVQEWEIYSQMKIRQTWF